MLSLYDFSVNGVLSPAFVPCDGLRFSWKLSSDRPATYQKSYSILLKTSSALLWESGEILSSRSIEIPCPEKLPARTDLTLLLKVTDTNGESALAEYTFSTALRPEDWQAKWIKPARFMESWAPYLQTCFDTDSADIASARLYVCGLGCGEYTVNGQKIAEDLIDPPMTNYEREVLYRIYDVKPYIQKHNALTALLGEGWYAQSQVWGPGTYKYGNPCLLAQLEIVYTDGHRQTVATNESDWYARYSPITLNNLYAGECYDCRLETKDILLYSPDHAGWEAVIYDTVPKGIPVFCQIAPVKILKKLSAKSVRAVSGCDDGVWIIDIGENVAGFAEFHMPPSPAGHQYVFRFAETVNPDGSLDVRSSGSFAIQCVQQDTYISRGDPEGEVWRPRFTYHAFRYIEVTGFYNCEVYGSEPDLHFADGYMISTELPQAGSFFCSHEDLNRLQTVMMSTFRSNYHGFPEDCPGREKCGWLGDAQVVCNTGMMNYLLEAPYEKYLHDIRTQTEVYGTWHMIAPGKRGCGDATPLWGCAQILLPYWLYIYYGDENAVYENWDLMQKWVEHEETDAKDFIITRGLGDWCPPCGHDSPRRIPVEESSTQMFYEICLRMSELCSALHLDGKERYDALAAKIKDSYIRHFWDTEAHRYSTWGSCGVALMTGLYPDGEKEALTLALLALIRSDDYAMSTGIYGNKYLIPALCEADCCDDAMEILFNRRHVSFGTMLDDGATSLWEGLELKGKGQPRDLHTSSYNHPMHSGFAYFMYAYIGGIRPLKPGFSEFKVAPSRFTDIDWVDISHETPYGKIALSYRRDEKQTVFDLTVPVNTTAQFSFGGVKKVLSSGIHKIAVPLN